MTDERQLPDPAARARQGAEGVPLEVAGREWLLAHVGLARVADRARDRLFDEIVLAGEVTLRDIREVAWIALNANYRLDPEETIAVLDAADEDRLVAAVRSVAFVHEHTADDRGYSAWARSSLAANGLDPARIARADLPHVLRQLVATGRAMPLSEFSRAGEYAATRQALLSME